MNDDPRQDEIDEGPSKSQLKREDAELETLARRLLGLRRASQDELPAGETLREALREWNRIRSHEARRRHLRRLVRLIREDDAEALARAADRLSPDGALSMALTRQAERWCERLLADPADSLTAFVAAHPGVDVQGLRQRQRKAAATAGESLTPAQRSLLKLVRAQLARDQD